MSQITLTNNAWAQTKLEVRAGNSPNCDNNGLQGAWTLALNESKTIETDESVVCWRRPLDPDDPDSGWQDWNTLSPDDIGNPYSIDMN